MVREKKYANWNTEEEAYLLACIKNNIDEKIPWNTDLVGCMAEGDFTERTVVAYTQKANKLAKRYDGTETTLHEQGPDGLNLDDEMKAALATALKKYVCPIDNSGDVRDFALLLDAVYRYQYVGTLLTLHHRFKTDPSKTNAAASSGKAKSGAASGKKAAAGIKRTRAKHSEPAVDSDGEQSPELGHKSGTKRGPGEPAAGEEPAPKRKKQTATATTRANGPPATETDRPTRATRSASASALSALKKNEKGKAPAKSVTMITEQTAVGQLNTFTNEMSEFIQRLIAERDTAVAERDTAMAERNTAIGERDTAVFRATRLTEELDDARDNSERLRDQLADAQQPDSLSTDNAVDNNISEEVSASEEVPAAKGHNQVQEDEAATVLDEEQEVIRPPHSPHPASDNQQNSTIASDPLRTPVAPRDHTDEFGRVSEQSVAENTYTGMPSGPARVAADEEMSDAGGDEDEPAADEMVGGWETESQAVTEGELDYGDETIL
jgi:hypothetical protein